MSAEMLKALLAMDGYASEVAATAHATVAALTRGGHGAVLLDLTMPGMTKDELLDSVARLPHPPVIIHSALPAAELAEAAAKIGAMATLAKPSEMEDLLAAVARALAQ